MMKTTWIAGLMVLWGLGTVNAQTRFVSDTAQTRRVLLEEYTAIHCGNCPDGHRIAAKIVADHPQQAFLMNVHGTALADPATGQTDLRSAYGDMLIGHAGVSAIPMGSINRHIFPPGTETALRRDFWEERVREALSFPSYVNIAAKARLDWKSRELSVTVQLYYTGTPAVASNFIHVAVLQDSIIGFQNGTGANPAQVTPDGQYMHMHAFRDFLTGPWGKEVSVPAGGKLVEKTFVKILPEKIGNVRLNLHDLHFIAFVSESKDEIMNVCRAEVENLNLPDCIAALSEPVQLVHATCDKNVRFSLKVTNSLLSSAPISRLTVAATSLAGTTEHVYEPSVPVEPGKSIRFETGTTSLLHKNKEERVDFRIVAINEGTFVERNTETLTAKAFKHYGITETPEITIRLQQDRFGQDITWILKDQSDETVAEGGPYQDLPAGQVREHEYPLTIADGCHTFAIYDKNRDGINSGAGEGFIRFSEKDGRVFVQHDGMYKDSAVIMLQIGIEEPEPVFPPDTSGSDTLSVVPAQARTIRIHPNPCTERIVIEADKSQERPTAIRILYPDGREALRVTSQVEDIDMRRFPSGFYILEIRTDKHTWRAKIMKR